MQAKCSRRKGCVLFAVHISSEKGKDVEDAEIFERYPILQQFQDVFPVEILEFPPHKEVGFSIELCCTKFTTTDRSIFPRPSGLVYNNRKKII